MRFEPRSPDELAAQLADAAGHKQAIHLCGNSTKDGMAGPIAGSDVTISTARLTRMLQYEPSDLTISVEAGMPWRELTRIAAQNRQMIPLDPPFSDGATVGGVVAANVSGPRRRLYGTARDMVIGMTFATLEGKLVKTGGMVVKNVAGLDMGKLMIGSFGTLAAIAVVNFRLHPMPHHTKTFVSEFAKASDAIATRDQVLKSTLQPAAVDIVRRNGACELLIQAGGSEAVLERYSHELPNSRVLEGPAEENLWREIREFTPVFLEKNRAGAVLRVSSVLGDTGRVLDSLPGPAISRAGTGVTYGYFPQAEALSHPAGVKSVVEFAPEGVRSSGTLWPDPGSDFATMLKIKDLFDPHHLLNLGRMYGRI